MNLRELEYLVAIDEERNFHRAAERCFVSQPTLSGQLKKLENELGVMLVERSQRQVVMTDVGNAVVTQAREVLVNTKAIRDIAQSFHDPMVGDMHVGLIPTVAPYLLPVIMKSLKKQHPDLKLWLHEHQTNVLLDKLRRAELDVLLLALPVETDEFAEIDLYNEDFWLAVPAADKLSQKSKVELVDLNEKEMLLLEEGHCLRGQALDVCFMAGASAHSGFQATSLETLRHMVAEGMGMTLLPELSVPVRSHKGEGIRYLPFSKPAPTRRIGMLYRKGSYREAACKKIGKVIRAQF